MSVLGNVINWILGLGAAIFVPIIIIIAGLIVGMKLKDAISAGITLGVAFTGMSMLSDLCLMLSDLLQRQC